MSDKVDLKRKLMILAVPAVLAVGGGAMVVAHAATPNPPTKPSASQTSEPGESAAETAAENVAENAKETGGAAEKADPAEAPGAAGTQTGHDDKDATGQAGHEFEGEE